MDKKQQRKYDERRLETLKEEYNNINKIVKAIRDDINDLTFEERVPDARERQLMSGRRYALECCQENIRETIVFLRARIQANRPEPWEEDSTHHCGQDAEEEDQTIPRLRHDVLGKEVICVGGSKSRCVGCPHDENGDDCVKLELLNGTYICLAKPQEDERPVISFDDEDNSTASGVMDDIRQKAEDFMNYIDSIVKPQE